MLLARLLLFAPLVLAVYCIRCYSGMQGAVNGDSIGKLEVLDCNSTDYCVKFPSVGHVGRKLYDGAQYSCSYGECSSEGCFKSGIGEICCCSEDECNDATPASAIPQIAFLFVALRMLLA